MKISVKNLRIAMIVLNLVFALGFAIHYGYGMAPEKVAEWVPFLSGESVTEVVQLRDPKSFQYREGQGGRVKEDPGSQVRVVGLYLQPVKPLPPPPPVDPTISDTVDDPDPEDEGPVEGGPLARDNWEYVQAIIFPENPKLSRVTIAKKPGETTTSSSRYRSRYSQSSRRTTSKSRSRAPAETLLINVSDRHFIDEEKDLDFWIDSVDIDRLVYWIDDPKKMYALPFTMDSWWREKGREDGTLGPRPEEDSEEDGEGEKKEKKHFEVVPANYEDLRDQEYEEIKKGKTLGEDGYIKAVDLAERRGKSASKATRSKFSSRRTSAAKTASSGKAPPPPTKSKPKSKAEQMQDLGSAVKDALNSDKASAKDKEELRKLNRALKGSPRK